MVFLIISHLESSSMPDEVTAVLQDQSYFMDEDMEASDQVEQLDATVLKRKRLEETDVGTNAKPASKATGKPVLNTRALRSVLKGVPLQGLLSQCRIAASLHHLIDFVLVPLQYSSFKPSQTMRSPGEPLL